MVKTVFVGHVDHGKSTLIGRLLLDTGSLPKEKVAEVRKISKELGSDAELAYITDQLKEEREQNITIDTTQTFFKTKKRDYVIIDAPGHVEFLKNMMTGAAQAELAVLLVDARDGVQEQTTRHAYIINMFGIDTIITVFNKMDLVGYSEKRFEELNRELLGSFDNLATTSAHSIPVSAIAGENVSKKSSKMKWYRGKTFLAALDSFTPDSMRGKRPLRFTVQDVYTIDGETVYVGRLVSGSMRRDQKITVLPTVGHSVIREIKVSGSEKTEAYEGENLGLVLADDLSIERGTVIVQREDPPEPTRVVRGNIFWMAAEPLRLDEPMTLRCATQDVECVAERIEKRIDSSTLEVIETDAAVLEQNEAGVVALKTARPILVEEFRFIRELGRFVLERNCNVQGAGIVARRGAVPIEKA